MVGVELSAADRKLAQSLLVHKKEEGLYIGSVEIVHKKKSEPRIIVISQHRLYVLKPGETKVNQDSHLLDLVEVHSGTSNEVTLVFKTFELVINSAHADDIIYAIRTAYELTFHGMPDEARFKADVKPASRLTDIPNKELPLGGFVNAYTSLCDYLGVPKREEICWDMEHTFSQKNIKIFDINEFEQPISGGDIKALLGALKHNKHFTSLLVNDTTVVKELNALADTLRSNTNIENLNISGIGAKGDSMIALTNALSANKNIGLMEFNVSNNPLEDKGVQALATYLQIAPRGIASLNASSTGATKAGTSALASALKKNVKIAGVLSHLDLSNNKLDAEGSSALAAFLATPNTLRTLVLSSTTPTLETIIGGLVRGCNELRHLDLSDNKLGKKEATILAKFISASPSLKVLNLNRTSIPVDSFKEILAAFSSNVYLQDVVLEAKGNDFGLAGARMIASLSEKINDVHTLDLDDNDFGDEGVSVLADGLCTNGSIRRLNLSRNFKASKSKTRTAMLDSIASLISSDCPLESLILAGGSKSQLRGDLVQLIYDLATNNSLLELDISGHQMGNKGAIALGKAVQTNSTLTTLSWDENATTLGGLLAFRNGLERNHSLKNMALPLLDLAQALKSDPPHKLQALAVDIEMFLNRNHLPTSQFDANKLSAFGNFAIINSGQQQNIEKLLLKIKSTGQKVEDSDQASAIKDAEITEKIIADIHLLREAIHQATEEELITSLKLFAAEAVKVIHKNKGELIQKIMGIVSESLKSMDQQSKRRLQTGIDFGAKDLDQNELEKILVKATGAQVSMKANEVLLSAVEITSDYIYEKIGDSLVQIFSIITNELDAEKQTTRSAQTPVPVKSDKPEKSDKVDKPDKAATSPSDKPDKPISPATNSPAGSSPSNSPSTAQRPSTPGAGANKVNANSAVAAAIARGVGGGMGRGMPTRPSRENSSETAASPVASPASTPTPPAATSSTGKSKPPPPKRVIGAAKDSKESEGPDLVHLTKDRPKVSQKRKAPSRRPRPPPSSE